MRISLNEQHSSAVIVNTEKVCAYCECFRSDNQLPSKALFFKEKAFIRHSESLMENLIPILKSSWVLNTRS